MRIVAVALAALILAGCTPADDDDDHGRRRYPPGYGVTPIPAPMRPAPAPPREVK